MSSTAPGPQDGRLAQREAAAHTDRHWVRLTRRCNNRCLFCLDEDAQDGSIVPTEAALRDIERGAALGRRRLVLSGGEPTLHPDLVALVAAGARAGYERVQLITNGRMLADGALLRALADAGLGEVTVSIHGHRAELHDRLVAVPGAFAETVRGLAAARQDGRLIVNADVVVCAPNVGHLEAIIALVVRLGVRELDLLQVQPAGRAARRPGLLYDPAEARASLDRVFELARAPDLFIWTNRFPVDHLEGHEELIQDPHKLVDEVRGRSEHVEALVLEGQPLPCRGERCRACFLCPLCDELHELARRLANDDFVEALVDLGRGPPPKLRRGHGRIERTRLIARDVEEARALAAGSLPGRVVHLWLESSAGLGAAPPVEVAGLPVERLAAEDPAVLAWALEAWEGEVEVAPSRDNEPILAALAAARPGGVVVRLAPRDRLSACLARDLPPDRLAAALSGIDVAVEDLPRCLAGGRPVTWTDPPLEVAALAVEPPDLELLVSRFAASRYRARSLRCGACAAREGCRGHHVQRLRAFGLGCLEPLG